jgi:type IV secretion system protein VirB8
MLNQKSQSADDLIKEYFDWDYDVNKSIRRRAKVAYWFAGFMGLIGVVSLFALNALTPLKEIQPLVVTVDSSTGITEVKHSLTGVDISKQEALDKYFIGRYVTAVEGYSYFSHKLDRENALGFSDGDARTKYYKDQAVGNPSAFVNVYRDNYQRKVFIKEVVLIDAKNRLAQVRFYVEDGRLDIPQYYTATLKYTYVDESKIPFTFLLKNPLGFVVTDYKVDEVAQ